jgi:tetratricopeptide (TPR) repeat protein
MSDKQIQTHLNKREFPQAEALIQAKLKGDPQSADAHYLLGVAHYFQGKIPETIECFRKALTIDPRHTDAAICLSVLFNDIGRYDDAKRVFETANHSVAFKKESGDQAINKKFAVKHLELADLYFRYRRYDEAIDEYTKATLLDSSHLEIRIRRAKAYAKKGFVARAIQELQQLKSENSRFLPARIQLGLLCYSQGNILDAELEWEGVLESDPRNKEAIAYLEMAKESRAAQGRPLERTPIL